MQPGRSWAKLGWPLPAELTDERLEQLLSPASGATPGARRHPEPDWAALVRDMKRPAVSLMILWEEYNGTHPQGYGYSCYVAATFMWRSSRSARNSKSFPEQSTP